MPLTDLFVNGTKPAPAVKISPGNIAFAGIPAAARKCKCPTLFIQTGTVGETEPMIITPVRIGIAKVCLRLLFAGTHVDVGGVANVSERVGIITDADGNIAIAKYIVEASPQSESSLTIIEVSH